MKKLVNKQTRYPFWLLPGLVVLIVLAGGGFAYLHYTNTNSTSQKSPSVRPVNTPSYTPSTPQDNAANNERKASSNPADTLDNGPTATTNHTLGAKIVSVSAANGNVHIGTMVSGATSGTCTLTASQGQSTVTLTTLPVKQDVNSYDCGGSAFNIPTSQFNPSSGTWQLKLSITSGGFTATDSSSVNL